MFTLRPGDGVLRVLELGFGEVFESLLIKIDGFRWMDRLGAEMMMGNVRGATFFFILWPLFETFSRTRVLFLVLLLRRRRLVRELVPSLLLATRRIACTPDI